MFTIALTIFFISYGLIVSERIHRTTVAIAGAVLMIVFGIVAQEDAFAAINFNTIGLLIGMMIIVAITKGTGLFQFVAIRAAQVAKGNPIKILVLLCIITAVFSAFLDNVTTILLIGPVTFVIADNLKINPIPYVMSEIIMANLGGAASLIGDPVNILVGSEANLSFLDFLFNLAPLVLILIPIVIGILKIFFRDQLKTTDELKEGIMQLKAKSAITDVPLLRKSLFTIGVTIFGFTVHSMLGLEPATIALFGAALLMILTDTHPEEVLKEIEWTTILFFAGLFVMVAGLEHVGFISILAGLLLDATNGSQTATTLALFWGSGLFSGLVDNLPFVVTMIPLVKELSASGLETEVLWWALALGAVLGGNTTIIGASTNLVGAGLAERAGHKIGFLQFAKVGATVMLVTMSVSTIYIVLRYLV